jgi:hypothetical protein
MVSPPHRVPGSLPRVEDKAGRRLSMRPLENSFAKDRIATVKVRTTLRIGHH